MFGHSHYPLSVCHYPLGDHHASQTASIKVNHLQDIDSWPQIDIAKCRSPTSLAHSYVHINSTACVCISGAANERTDWTRNQWMLQIKHFHRHLLSYVFVLRILLLEFWLFHYFENKFRWWQHIRNTMPTFFCSCGWFCRIFCTLRIDVHTIERWAYCSRIFRRNHQIRKYEPKDMF